MNLMLRMVRGFVDLISLAVMSECKFQAMNMTTMRVQGLPTLLNKNVSAGDDCWELRWEEIPEALRCYALGDIRFGFITYNVLAGLLLRDIFSRSRYSVLFSEVQSEYCHELDPGAGGDVSRSRRGGALGGRDGPGFWKKESECQDRRPLILFINLIDVNINIQNLMLIDINIEINI